MTLDEIKSLCADLEWIAARAATANDGDDVSCLTVRQTRGAVGVLRHLVSEVDMFRRTRAENDRLRSALEKCRDATQLKYCRDEIDEICDNVLGVRGVREDA